MLRGIIHSLLGDIIHACCESIIINHYRFVIFETARYDFYPRTPKIFWNVKAGEELSELYFRLYTGLEQPIPFKQYQPHVTVAREISYHRVLLIKEKIVGYLPDESFEAEKIELISPLPNNRWVSVRTFPLSGPTPASGQ